LLHAWRSECHPVKYAELRFELRDLSRALQPGREADVRRQRMATILRHAPAALLQESRLQLAKLDQQRSLIRHQLRDTLHSPRWKRGLVLIAKSLNSPELFALPNTTENLESESEVFNKQLDKLLKESARKKFATQDLHDLRIKMKSIRYHGDALIDMQGLEPLSELKRLHRLQSLLGDIHDNQQLMEWCRQADFSTPLKAHLQRTLSESAGRLTQEFDYERRR
jgi:CHAD domain-containing protein